MFPLTVHQYSILSKLSKLSSVVILINHIRAGGGCKIYIHHKKDKLFLCV